MGSVGDQIVSTFYPFPIKIYQMLKEMRFIQDFLNIKSTTWNINVYRTDSSGQAKQKRVIGPKRPMRVHEHPPERLRGASHVSPFYARSKEEKSP